MISHLYIAGSGIQFLSQITLETQSLVVESDCVAYLVNDPAMKIWVQENSKKSFDLDEDYFIDGGRDAAYRSICNRVMNFLKDYKHVCFLVYGHPLLLSSVSYMLIDECESHKDKVTYKLFPAISSLDMLLCDLKIDPGFRGIQCYEAKRLVDECIDLNKNTPLVIWQIGVVGVTNIIHGDYDCDMKENKVRREYLCRLYSHLRIYYPKKQKVIFYQASIYSNKSPIIVELELSKLPESNPGRLVTAYLEPIGES